MDELLCHYIQSANGWAHRAMWNKSKDSTCRLPRGLASLFHKTPQECAHNQYNLCFSLDGWMSFYAAIYKVQMAECTELYEHCHGPPSQYLCSYCRFNFNKTSITQPCSHQRELQQIRWDCRQGEACEFTKMTLWNVVVSPAGCISAKVSELWMFLRAATELGRAVVRQRNGLQSDKQRRQNAQVQCWQPKPELNVQSIVLRVNPCRNKISTYALHRLPTPKHSFALVLWVTTFKKIVPVFKSIELLMLEPFPPHTNANSPLKIKFL